MAQHNARDEEKQIDCKIAVAEALFPKAAKMREGYRETSHPAQPFKRLEFAIRRRHADL